MQVEVLTSTASFRSLEAEWWQLLRQVPGRSVFLTPQWQATWWRHFGAGRQLCLWTVRTPDGRLQGLAPLMTTGNGEAPGRLEFIGDQEVCDYLDLLIAPAVHQEVGRALVEALLAESGETCALALRNLPADSLTPAILRDSLEENGFRVVLETIETCPVIPLAGDWETYLDSLRGKDRHELRRKLRRAEAAARLECYVTSARARLDDDLETFFTLHRLSQQDAKRGFMTAAKAAFFRDMAQALWPQGLLELVFLHADGVPIAGLWCFPFETTYAAYNACYHPDYKHLSAGIVLFAERIRSAMQRGFTLFDFLRGDEPYKYRFGATDRPLYQFLAGTGCPVPGACR